MAGARFRTVALLAGTLSFAGCAAQELNDMVGMYKLAAGECGYVMFDRKFAGLPAWQAAGFQEGSCQDRGYTESEGTKEVMVPLLGTLKIDLFQKPDIIGLALTAGAQLAGIPGSTSCCRSCAEPKQKYVSTGAAGECHEACMEPAKQWLFSMAGVLDEGLVLAQNKTCGSLGFPMYNSTVTKGIEPVGVSWDVYQPSPPNTAILHMSFIPGVCGEVQLADWHEDAGPGSQGSVAQVLGLRPGSCADSGYTRSMGSKWLPELAGAKMTLFRKDGDLDIVDGIRVAFNLLTQDNVQLFKILGDICSEATVDRKFEDALMMVGLSEGSCSAQGFLAASGNQEIRVPLLGSIQLALYKKTADSGPLVV